jgi:DNA-binding transcriptional LysR family regulator
MEMHQIRYFLGVARTLNFTRAAEECHVSQPSLTRAIKLLEDELGGELFRRERNLSHLTDLGQRMLPLMQQCYDTAQGAKALATSIRKGEVATLRLALSRTIDLALVIPLLSELMRAINGLDIKFLRGTADEVVEIMKRGDADIAITGPVGASWERLDSWPLFSEGFRLALHAEHRLSESTAVALADLAGERVLALAYCELGDQIAALLRSRGINIGHGHEVFSERDLISLLESRLGVALVPSSASLTSCLRQVAVQDLDLSRTVFVHAVAGRPRDLAAATFLKQLQAADWDAHVR